MRHLLICMCILFVASVPLTLCSKKAQEKMTIEQLKVKTGIDLIAAWEFKFGNARVAPNGKAKPQKNGLVTLTEGNFTWDGVNFTTCDNVKFAGVNNQTTFVSICNWYFVELTPPQNLSCTDTSQHGQIMAWDCDWNNNVRRGNLVTQ